MTEQKDQPLDLSAWRLNLKRYGKSHWLKFYTAFLGSSVSSPARFYRAVSLYGDWAMFEAILATSTADIKGDPLNYVLKVCHSKWKEMQEDAEQEAELLENIEEQKKVSQKQNDELAKKLKKVKRERHQ